VVVVFRSPGVASILTPAPYRVQAWSTSPEVTQKRTRASIGNFNLLSTSNIRKPP